MNGHHVQGHHVRGGLLHIEVTKRILIPEAVMLLAGLERWSLCLSVGLDSSVDVLKLMVLGLEITSREMGVGRSV